MTAFDVSNNSAGEKIAYVVVGSHRSGTSALARVLNLAGAALPLDVLPPHPVDNPRGYWEPRLVTELNDDILAASNGDWKHPPPAPIMSPAAFADRAQAIIAQQYAHARAIVLKDPRISLAIPFWRDMLFQAGYRPVFILMVRQPEQVAASLQRRGDMTYEEGLAIWAAYTMRAERDSRQANRIIASFDDLLENWRSILKRLPTGIDAQAANRIDGYLCRELRHLGDRAETVLRGCDLADIYRLLTIAAETSPKELDWGRLDAHWAKIEAHWPAEHRPEEKFDSNPTETASRQVEVQTPMRAGRPNWVLVTGAPRGGTSLLRAMLAEHPNVALLQEYGLVQLIHRVDAIIGGPRARADWDTPVDPSDSNFARIAAFYRDRPGRDAVTRGGGDFGPAHFHDIVLGLFASLAPDKSLQVIGDKMPITRGWEGIDMLVERIPSLRLAIVIRNPADVVRSSLIRREATRLHRDAWPIRTVQQAVCQWIFAWREICELVRDHGDKVHVLKYEDLCREPADSMKPVYAFLGLPPYAPQTPIASLPSGLRAHDNDEETVLLNLLGPVIDAWPNQNATALLAEFLTLREPYTFGDLVKLGHETASEHLHGFSFREDWGRWTEGSHAGIRLTHGESKALLFLEIFVQRTFQRSDVPCEVALTAGWGESKLITVGEPPTRITMLARAEDAVQNGIFEVEILVLHPKSPDEAPSDSRALGIGISSFRLTRLPTTPAKKCLGAGAMSSSTSKTS